MLTALFFGRSIRDQVATIGAMIGCLCAGVIVGVLWQMIAMAPTMELARQYKRDAERAEQVAANASERERMIAAGWAARDARNDDLEGQTDFAGTASPGVIFDADFLRRVAAIE